MIPLQDVLGLSSDARMNMPSQSLGNWTWRYAPGSLSKPLADALAALAEVTDRVVPPPAAGKVKQEQFSV